MLSEQDRAAIARNVQELDEAADRYTAALAALTGQQVPALLAELARLRAGLEDVYNLLPSHTSDCARVYGNNPCNCAIGKANTLIQQLVQGQTL